MAEEVAWEWGKLSEIPQKVVEQKRGEGKQRVKKGRASGVKRWVPERGRGGGARTPLHTMYKKSRKGVPQ